MYVRMYVRMYVGMYLYDIKYTIKTHQDLKFMYFISVCICKYNYLPTFLKLYTS